MAPGQWDREIALPSDGLEVIQLGKPTLQILERILRQVRAGSAAGDHDAAINQSKQITSRKDVKHIMRGGEAGSGWADWDEVSMKQQYRDVKAPPAGRAVYMQNLGLHTALGPELLDLLYDSMPLLEGDVMRYFPQFFDSDNPASTSDILMGSVDSWSPIHMDLPLHVCSLVIVLEGSKQFAVFPDRVHDTLRGMFKDVAVYPRELDAPFTDPCTKKRYPNVKAYIEASGGRVFELHVGQALMLPPRVYHYARNTAACTSINASYCRLEDVPRMLHHTFTWMSSFKGTCGSHAFGPGMAALLKLVTQQMVAGNLPVPMPPDAVPCAPKGYADMDAELYRKEKSKGNGKPKAKQAGAKGKGTVVVDAVAAGAGLAQQLASVWCEECSEWPAYVRVRGRVVQLGEWMALLSCIPRGVVHGLDGNLRMELQHLTLRAHMQLLAGPPQPPLALVVQPNQTLAVQVLLGQEPVQAALAAAKGVSMLEASVVRDEAVVNAGSAALAVHAARAACHAAWAAQQQAKEQPHPQPPQQQMEKEDESKMSPGSSGDVPDMCAGAGMCMAHAPGQVLGAQAMSSAGLAGPGACSLMQVSGAEVSRPVRGGASAASARQVPQPAAAAAAVVVKRAGKRTAQEVWPPLSAGHPSGLNLGGPRVQDGESGEKRPQASLAAASAPAAQMQARSPAASPSHKGTSQPSAAAAAGAAPLPSSPGRSRGASGGSALLPAVLSMAAKAMRSLADAAASPFVTSGSAGSGHVTHGSAGGGEGLEPQVKRQRLATLSSIDMLDQAPEKQVHDACM